MDTHYCYFADYEILVGGRFIVWAQATLDYAPDAPGHFDPAELLDRIRRQAAHAHGVERDEVRVRNLSRLL